MDRRKVASSKANLWCKNLMNFLKQKSLLLIKRCADVTSERETWKKKYSKNNYMALADLSTSTIAWWLSCLWIRANAVETYGIHRGFSVSRPAALHSFPRKWVGCHYHRFCFCSILRDIMDQICNLQSKELICLFSILCFWAGQCSQTCQQS